MKIILDIISFHSRYRYREILFLNYFRYEFGQMVRKVPAQWPDRGKLLPRGKNNPAITSRQK